MQVYCSLLGAYPACRAMAVSSEPYQVNVSAG